MKLLKTVLMAVGMGLVLSAFVWVMLIFRSGAIAREVVGDFRPVTSGLADGKYQGVFIYAGFIRNQVVFDIRDGKLGVVQFTKLFGTPGYGAPQSVSNAIDERRDLDFDSITGATITSSLAKATIKDAIEKGPLK